MIRSIHQRIYFSNFVTANSLTFRVPIYLCISCMDEVGEKVDIYVFTAVLEF
jgi:hypothetical protein